MSESKIKLSSKCYLWCIMGRILPVLGLLSLKKDVMKKIFDKAIAFNRVFVDLTGSVTSALLLSQACYWSQRTNSDDGWFYKTQEEWEEETGLGRYEFEGARKKAKKYLKYELRGIPAKSHYFVDWDAIYEDCGIFDTKNGPKSANKDVENQQTSKGKTSKHSITENTTENTYSSYEKSPPEINEILGFPLPDDWQDDSYVDSENRLVEIFTDELGRKIPQSTITARRKQFKASQRVSIKPREEVNQFCKESVKELQIAQGIFKLDGKENHKEAKELEAKLRHYLETQFDLIDIEEDKLIEQYKGFLKKLQNNSFHWPKATSMRYINNNFNKIVREI